jgi:hypothetical protein
MHHTSPRRNIVLLAVLVLLTVAPWASAGPRNGSGHPVRISGAVVLPDLLSRAWSFVTGVWTKEGCNIDPNGRCLSAPSPLPTKEGCQIDPGGRCLSISSPPVASPTKSTDTGCQIDPGGRCSF